jgi:hypothetical protein
MLSLCRFIKCPKDPNAKSSVESTDETAAFKLKSQEQVVAEVALGGVVTYAATATTVYRVKKEGAFGGYKVVSESAAGAGSRESLLDQRSKKKSDRHCY